MALRVELFRAASLRGRRYSATYNTAHVIRESTDGYVLTECGLLYPAWQEIATDHKTHLCRLCMRVKDKHDRGKRDRPTIRQGH